MNQHNTTNSLCRFLRGRNSKSLKIVFALVLAAGVSPLAANSNDYYIEKDKKLNADIAAIKSLSTALIEPFGAKTKYGTDSSPFVLPPSNAEPNAQSKYCKSRPKVEMLANKMLFEEIAALEKWSITSTANRIEIMGGRKVSLENEVNRRAKELDNYCDNLREIREMDDSEYAKEFAFQIESLAEIIEGEIYKRAVNSSIVPLLPYVSKENREWWFSKFKDVDKKTVWNPASTGAGSNEDGNGIVLSNEEIVIDNMYFIAYPSENRAHLERVDESVIGGKDIAIPAYIKKEGKKCPVITVAGDFSEAKSVVIPSTTKEVYITFPKTLTRLEIPSSVKKIRASFDHTKLEELVIPENVEEIASFLDCTSLKKVVFSPKSKVETIAISTFQNCTSLESVVLPTNLKTIELDAFYGCTSLTEITIPVSVKSIKFGAFNKCKNLKKVTLSKKFRTKVQMLFSECPVTRDATLSGFTFVDSPQDDTNDTKNSADKSKNSWYNIFNDLF